VAVVPLVLGQTVATTEKAFEDRGGLHGSTLLIRNFDATQLSGDEPNLSYDLRIGTEYKDHRDEWKKEVSDDGHVELLPGGAVIIETEESLRTRVGTGRKSDGGFCSLDCYANFYQLELSERARRLSERIKRKES